MSDSSTFVAAVLEDLERGVSLPVLDEPGASSKLTLLAGTYDLYVLERLAAALAVTREDLASRLLAGALTDAASHPIATSILDYGDADDYIYAVEMIRGLQLNLAALRRGWKALLEENRPVVADDGKTATGRSLEVQHSLIMEKMRERYSGNQSSPKSDEE